MTTTNRIAAITGGAGALGSELARTLAAKGYKVALFDTERSKERLATLVGQLGPDKAFGYASDFASDAAWGAALDAAKAALGGLPTHAALIAGGWAGGTPVHATTDDSSYQRMITTNVDSAYRALRALLPAMVAAKSGSIVVVGSRAVERPWTSAGSAAYAAAKAAVVTIAQTVAQEVLDEGVRINAILPSTMDTPANRADMPEADPSKWVSLSSAAGVIAFLLSDDARDVSGAAIPVYGRA
ncbi:MAG TPA: SDR family NAD(P)-dependent oxidoreductase [Labilithrix sp.]|nr:SDR family NAD(P)-dependent oxidoreductase [Labilithrix sp.]